jgi:hypothetical protein
MKSERATRGNVTRTEAGRYEVLGLVSIAVFGSWWWHTEDMNDSTARGAIFDAMKKTMIRSLRIY